MATKKNFKSLSKSAKDTQGTPKPGRGEQQPSSKAVLTPKRSQQQKIAKVLAVIETGKSMREACKVVGINECTFRKMVNKNDELSTQYARAREMCADVQFDEMEDLERQCLDGGIDPKAFRSAMDSRKWRLARMKPKSYGDKIEHSGKDGGPLQITVVRFSDTVEPA